MHCYSNQGQMLIPQAKLCEMLGKSRSGLAKLRKNDPSFPKPLKYGANRQARCAFVAEEIIDWLKKKTNERDSV